MNDDERLDALVRRGFMVGGDDPSPFPIEPDEIECIECGEAHDLADCPDIEDTGRPYTYDGDWLA